MLFDKKLDNFEQKFETMGLNGAISQAIKSQGFKKPTEIQKVTIPLIMTGRDIIACAKTGTGKTASFVIPMVQRLEKHTDVVGARALIIVPTRDLAMQILTVIKDFTRFTDLRRTVIVGGHMYEGQFESLASNPDIIIATPGRLMQLLDETSFSLKKVEYLVFDEADSLFEMGFTEQVVSILKKVSQKRQTLLFSATIPQELSDFAAAGLNDYRLIRLDSEYSLPDNAILHFLLTRTTERLALLILLLQQHVRGKVIIFCPTKHVVEFLGGVLPHFNVPCVGIYGKQDNEVRTEFMERFKNDVVKVMVVTDLAARGLDIPSVKNVINYGYPQNQKSFVHRCGRTARAGRSGSVWTLLCLPEKNYMSQIELNLDRKLQNTAPMMESQYAKPIFDKKYAYYGRVKQKFLLEHIEVVKDLVSNDIELREKEATAKNSMKKFRRSRSKATIESAQHLKNIDLESPHPLFFDSDAGNIEAVKMIKAYKPVQSYLELATKKEGNQEDKQVKILATIEKMKKLRTKILKKGVIRDNQKAQEENWRKEQKRQYQEREIIRVELEEKAEKQMQKYKSSLYISNTEDKDKKEAFFNKEKITNDDLNTFTMENNVEQLYEQRKYMWDHSRKTYKKLKVDMKGNVLREKVKKDLTGPSVTERYQKWKKQNLIGIQREGEAELKSVSSKAQTMLSKRTKGKITAAGIRGQREKKNFKNGQGRTKKKNLLKKKH